MGGVNPWRVLRAREDIVLDYGWLRGCRGRTVDHGAFYRITLDARLDRVTRRCVLMHELVHIELDVGFRTLTAEARHVAKAEALVHLETARRLVPPDELEAWAARLVDAGEQLDLVDVARQFDVTTDVAARAVELLATRRRGAA